MPDAKKLNIINPYQQTLFALIGVGFASGFLLLGGFWFFNTDLGLASSVFAVVMLFMSVALGAVAFRLYASLSLRLAQNDQKHIQNAIIQAKDMLDSSKQLRDDHILLQSLAQNLPYPIWLKDRFGRYLVTNKAFVNQWCNKVDPIGKTDADLLNKTLASAFAEADKDVLSTHKAHILELKLEISGQPPRWVKIERYALLGEDGKVTGVLGLAVDISPYKRAKTDQHSGIDFLTGFANQHSLNNRIQNAPNNDSNEVCLHIDLDHFKVLNDSLGKDTGDILLKTVADRIRQCSPSGSFLARVSADEFVAIWPAQEGMLEAIDRLHELVKQPISLADGQYSFTASIGAAQLPDHGQDLKEVEQNASIALFNAKKRGRNQIHWYNESYEGQATRRLNKEQMLRQAIADEAFVIHVQPRIDCRTNEIEALECLARIKTDNGEVHYPGAFINLAESNGLIRHVDLYILESALTLLQGWVSEGQTPVKLAVNLSLQSINQTLIDHLYQWQVREPRVFDYLELELTEHRLPENNQNFLTLLYEIRELGICLALDDFGTGYANLSRLPDWPFQILKLDRSFIAHLNSSEKQQTVVRSIVGMCNNLGIKVVAEGIETEEELTLIDQLGCHSIQGFVYAKPKPIEEVEDWLSQKKITLQ
jgi:diguanylate cyclase (GGDEF)-like protein